MEDGTLAARGSEGEIRNETKRSGTTFGPGEHGVAIGSDEDEDLDVDEDFFTKGAGQGYQQILGREVGTGNQGAFAAM